MPLAATWIDLEIIVLSEVSQIEKEKSHDIAYIWTLKSDTSELIDKTEVDSQTQKTNLWLQAGKVGKG